MRANPSSWPFIARLVIVVGLLVVISLIRIPDWQTVALDTVIILVYNWVLRKRGTHQERPKN
jgi:hypothetical protein